MFAPSRFPDTNSFWSNWLQRCNLVQLMGDNLATTLPNCMNSLPAIKEYSITGQDEGPRWRQGICYLLVHIHHVLKKTGRRTKPALVFCPPYQTKKWDASKAFASEPPFIGSHKRMTISCRLGWRNFFLDLFVNRSRWTSGNHFHFAAWR